MCECSKLTLKELNFSASNFSSAKSIFTSEDSCESCLFGAESGGLGGACLNLGESAILVLRF